MKLDLDSEIFMKPKSVISNIKISNITDHGALITWDGESNPKVWLIVVITGKDGPIHNTHNNSYEFTQLGAGYSFLLKAKGSDNIVHTMEFTTKN